jgi:transmembrane sensor
MNINNIDDLITKFLHGEANPQEAMFVEDWKNENIENRNYYNQMAKTMSLINKQRMSEPNKEEAWKRFYITNLSSTRKIWYMGIAASIAIIVASIFVIRNSAVENSVIQSGDLIMNKVLPDNTEINLGKNSSITIEEGYGDKQRRIKLKGEASFNVIHDETKPFVIDANNVFIEDLGTKFTIKSLPSSDTLYVVVNEGIVRLYDELGQELIIKAGEHAWYIRSQKKIIASTATTVIKFDFKDTKLSEAIDLIEKSYDTNIELRPTAIGDCKITVQFFDEELATIITVISETLGLKYEYQDRTYTLKGKVCQ